MTYKTINKTAISHKNTRVYSKHEQGFSIIELLVVIAIIGILLGLFTNNYINSMRKAEVKTAATQVMSELISARSKSQRESRDYQFSWDSKATEYMIGPVGELKTKTISSKVSMRCVKGCEASKVVTYTSPYSVIRRNNRDATGFILEFSSPHSALRDQHYYVKAVGVTGKVSLVGSLE